MEHSLGVIVAVMIIATSCFTVSRFVKKWARRTWWFEYVDVVLFMVGMMSIWLFLMHFLRIFAHLSK